MGNAVDSIESSASIDPSARIDSTARIGADVQIGPDVIVGPHCVIGDRCVLRARSIIWAHTTMGVENDVHPYAVLGGDPQDKAYDPDVPGRLIIGDANIFREGVTVNRSTGDERPTTVGSGCFLMSQSHLGHNVTIGDEVILANGASVAGHARIGSGTVMSAFCVIHQFTHIGEMVMFRGLSAVGMHVPPYVIIAGGNNVAGINVVGLRRRGFTQQERDEIKTLFRMFYRDRGTAPIPEVYETVRTQTWTDKALRFINFIGDSLTQQPPRNRGICGSGRDPHT
ncbi:MAG: acyl-ACP--UDP-N-acetylglucosamine O-acyltransferase [Planctomycetota bacterium]